MKWDCGPSGADRVAAASQWHDHFAWWPRRVGSHDCRWLETIERRWASYSSMSETISMLSGKWEYRARGAA